MRIVQGTIEYNTQNQDYDINPTGDITVTRVSVGECKIDFTHPYAGDVVPSVVVSCVDQAHAIASVDTPGHSGFGVTISKKEDTSLMDTKFSFVCIGG